MTARVAINGFGRVGRLCLRSMLERHKNELSVVALNDLADLKTNAHLLQYDSSYGPFTRKVEIGEGSSVSIRATTDNDHDYYELIGDDDGVFGCMSVLACHDVCPKNLPLASKIAFLRRKMVSVGVEITFDSGLQRLRKCGKGESYEDQP